MQILSRPSKVKKAKILEKQNESNQRGKDIILGHLGMSKLYVQRDIKGFESALKDERRKSRHEILYG